ncbi:MAG: dimethylargininase [Anaerolineaceae bacterium]|nr:dimethylargininase [Anaerolineaceae bacterium]MCB9101403.1 dimethylargininase [Anaerolineales bacterium]
MLTAITHRPAPALNQCELTFLSAQVIDIDQANRQHAAYCDLLRQCGAEVITLDKNLHMPDSVFVEDTALVLDEIAIITSMGAVSRRAETAAIETELAHYRPISRLCRPAQVEGGDVLRIGHTLYVGLSTRTNAAGVKALAELVAPYGYEVIGVSVTGCLHLKTGCTALDDRTLLLNPNWIDPAPLAGFEQIPVPEAEPFAANILRIGQTICLHAGFTQTGALLDQRGYQLEVVDISEFLKAEAGLTCMSLIFNS